MNLHEYQTKQILPKYGIPVPRGRVAASPHEASEVFKSLNAAACAVKAQIHAGGRGKAGGIKLVRSADEAGAAAQGMLGKPLVTHQTGPQGKIVNRVWIEEACEPERELYAGIVLDRKAASPVMMVSSEGGMDIEEVSAKKPEAILKEAFDVATALKPFQARRLAFQLPVRPELMAPLSQLLANLSRAFIDNDCSLLEINPLVVTRDGKLLALDAKMGIDDRSLGRHPDLAELRDPTEEDPRELEATKVGISYISMDGNIGCMVNGAGLAMSTMDIIKLHGGNPANFLDVGGGANKDQVATAFKLLLANEKVKAVLINIFGGILKCDVLAQGILDALKVVEVRVPLVVRLEGTNVEKGRQMLSMSGLAITTASDMTDAAKKAVEAAKYSEDDL